jgi:hypothetical protein
MGVVDARHARVHQGDVRRELDNAPSAAAFAWTGVGLHIACALLVLVLAGRWMPAMARDCPRPGLAALLCALVFALHPAQTEAVVYAAARSTTLSTLATLLGLYAWERARTGSRARWIALCALALAGSLAAREAAWTLPFAIVLVELARGARLRDAMRATAWLWIALAALVAIGTTIAAHRRLLASSIAIRGPLDNLVAQVDAVFHLVTHPLLTMRLNFDPDLAVRDAIDGAWLAKLAAIVAVLAFGARQLRRRPWLGFAILWFALALLPTHSFLARLELANDRQLYLAMVGPALAIGVALASMRARALAVTAATVSRSSSGSRRSCVSATIQANRGYGAPPFARARGTPAHGTTWDTHWPRKATRQALVRRTRRRWRSILRARVREATSTRCDASLLRLLRGFRLRFRLRGAVARDGFAHQRLERGRVDRLALVDVDGAAHVALEARVEEARGIVERRAFGKRELHGLLVRLARADDAVERPHGDVPLPFLDDVLVRTRDQRAYAAKRVGAPVAEALDLRVDHPRRGRVIRRIACLHASSGYPSTRPKNGYCGS